MAGKKWLASIVAKLNEAPEPDERLILWTGAGELEDLVRRHGSKLWHRIERLARRDPRLRRALTAVWAYDSPEFARRERLLRELGEFWPVTVRFIVERNGFGSVPRLSWRAVRTKGDVPGNQLPRVLREIAESVEQPSKELGRWLRDADVADSVWEWDRALSDLQQRRHDLLFSPSRGQGHRILGGIEAAREAELLAWNALHGALTTSRAQDSP